MKVPVHDGIGCLPEEARSEHQQPGRHLPAGGPQGGKKSNYATAPDNRPLPPTTQLGDGCVPVKVTPTSNR
jgi:hypothetical protein